MCGTKQYNTIYKLDGVAPSEKQQYCYCPKQGKACMDKHTVETEKQNTPLICEGWQSAPLGGGVFLPPLPEVGCLIFLEIRNPWGKVMERTGLTFEHFCLEVV